MKIMILVTFEPVFGCFFFHVHVSLYDVGLLLSILSCILYFTAFISFTTTVIIKVPGDYASKCKYCDQYLANKSDFSEWKL